MNIERRNKVINFLPDGHKNKTLRVLRVLVVKKEVSLLADRSFSEVPW